MPVLTVPMRNGNAEVENLQKLVVGSYRTYEEWKHDVDLKTTYKFVTVLTVPMRNGNFG